MSKSIFKDIKFSNIITGLPPYHYSSDLHNFEDKYVNKDKKFYTSLYELTLDILDVEKEKQPRYVFLCGVPGCGKTHYMVGLYKALVCKLGYIQGSGVMFTTFINLAQEIIGMFKDNIPLRTSMQGYTQSQWLFLDDFTSSERVLKEGSLEYNILRDILIERYETRHILITSSNLSSIDLVPELDRLFGSYISSRLSESKIVQFPEIDFRGK